MASYHPILVFMRSFLCASAHTAGQGGGADVAALEREQLVKGLIVADAGDRLDITDGQHLAAIAGL